MLSITLVRHGQAAFGTDNYDRLTDLGHQQARWLGEYLAERDAQFDRVLVGSQLRHRQTAEGILAQLGEHPALEQHEGFNEYDFDALSACFRHQYPEQLNSGYEGRKHYYAILKLALLAWSQNKLNEPPESWQAFNQRLTDALQFARRQPSGKVLVISSGGAISTLISQVIGLHAEGTIKLNLQMRNTSVSELIGNQHSSQLASFNHVPHLDIPARHQHITYS